MVWMDGSKTSERHQKGLPMTKELGYPLPLGVTVKGDEINFAVTAPKGKECSLILYKAGSNKVCDTYDMTEEHSVGEVRFLTLQGMNPKKYEYNFCIDQEVVVDPYARALAGREQWTEQCLKPHEVRGMIVDEDEYDWSGDKKLCLPDSEVIAYRMHVRGFTRHISSKVKARGTFEGVIEKIPYLQELGVNQIQCMPIYEFNEYGRKVNYWGYGPGYCLAPKRAYSSQKDGIKSLKDMVKACHRAGIEVVLEMPFYDGLSTITMGEILRFYAMDYHVDGFLLNPYRISLEHVADDPILRGLKILKESDDYQITMRRFLKGDEGMVNDVIWKLRRLAKDEGVYNYMTSHNGFTMADLVSYDGKHNESNSENNQDGPEYNYSWNCGAEGPTRKKSVLDLRKKQMRNAFFLLLMGQGTPCLYAGDEFANSQKGNNNAYCQDNAISWLDWKNLEKEKELFHYVKHLIALRKAHPALRQDESLTGMDRKGCGMPDVSYHGVSAWQVPSQIPSRQLGVLYSGAYAEDDECFIAYNMHWLKHSFALPTLKKGKKWYGVVDTAGEIQSEPELLKDQKEIIMSERSIGLFIGR